MREIQPIGKDFGKDNQLGKILEGFFDWGRFLGKILDWGRAFLRAWEPAIFLVTTVENHNYNLQLLHYSLLTSDYYYDKRMTLILTQPQTFPLFLSLVDQVMTKQNFSNQVRMFLLLVPIHFA